MNEQQRHQAVGLLSSVGARMIVTERGRQIEAEGYDFRHDDDHAHGELLAAAMCYADAADVVRKAPSAEEAIRRVLRAAGVDPDTDDDLQRMIENPARHFWGWDKAPTPWPWAAEYWKPSPTVERNLAKAGALLAAELDGCVHWDRIETCRKWHMFIAPGFAGDFSCAAFEALKPEQLKGEET